VIGVEVISGLIGGNRSVRCIAPREAARGAMPRAAIPALVVSGHVLPV
jgi:hypothetical protein